MEKEVEDPDPDVMIMKSFGMKDRGTTRLEILTIVNSLVEKTLQQVQTVFLVNTRTTSIVTQLVSVSTDPTDVMEVHIRIAEEMTKGWKIVIKFTSRGGL